MKSILLKFSIVHFKDLLIRQFSWYPSSRGFIFLGVNEGFGGEFNAKSNNIDITLFVF